MIKKVRAKKVDMTLNEGLTSHDVFSSSMIMMNL